MCGAGLRAEGGLEDGSEATRDEGYGDNEQEGNGRPDESVETGAPAGGGGVAPLEACVAQGGSEVELRVGCAQHGMRDLTARADTVGAAETLGGRSERIAGDFARRRWGKMGGAGEQIIHYARVLGECLSHVIRIVFRG